MTARSALAFTVEGPFLQAVERREGTVTRCERVAIPAEARQGGHITDQQALTVCARALLRKLPSAPKRVTAALPSHLAVWRLVTLPPIPRRYLETAVLQEQQRSTSAAETLHMAWGVLSGGGQAPWQVFMLSAPRRPLYVMARGLQAAGAPPQTMEIRALAALRAAGLATCIAVNADSETIEVATAVDGAVMSIRAAYLGDSDNDPVYLQERLVDEILRALGPLEQQFQTSFPAATPVVLSGQLAMLPGLAQEIEAATGRSVIEPQIAVQIPLGMSLCTLAAGIGCSLS